MSFLEDYISSISFLPTEVQRSLEVIKSLDKKVEEAQNEFTNVSSQYFQSLKKQGQTPVEDPALYLKLEELHKTSLDLTEEKIIIAQHLKAMLEPCMNRLTKDLEEFKNRLANNAMEMQRSRRGEPFDTEGFLGYNSAEFIGGQDADKTYCVCEGPAGERNMIACEGPNCKKEWFHFECVGLTSMPSGDWYCPECRSSFN